MIKHLVNSLIRNDKHNKYKDLAVRKIIWVPLFLGIIILTPSTVFSNKNALEDIFNYIENQKLYYDPMWLALLHYKKEVNNRFVSEADGKGFFLSKYGKKDPKEEMIASIKAFLESNERYSGEVMHPQCRFPARYKWIKSVLKEKGAIFKDIKCDRYEDWAYLLRPKGMSLIYAAGYLNNPASMFGHTFIRLERKEKGIESDLLSYAINYAAIPTTSNALFYAILGLTGGFEGRFSTLPYYMKVKEYGSMEHRDLWEYHLNINEEQLEYVLKHIWELGQTYFNYYYIDENCSYHILSLIQIAYPELDFREFFSVYTVPQDTIKFLLRHPNIIKGVTYRPSLKSEVENMIISLTKDEIEIAIKIAKSDTNLHIPEEFYTLREHRKAIVLDMATLLFRFYKGYGLPEREEKEVASVERQILLLRSKIDVPSNKVSIPAPTPPHKSHGPAMLSIGGGLSKNGFFESLELKPVLHDLISREDGYEPLTQIDMLKLSLRFNNDLKRVLIDGFDFIRIISIAELRSWLKKLSWNLSIGTEADYRRDISNLKYITFLLRGGPGIGFSTHMTKRETYFLFWENRIVATTDFDVTFYTGFMAGLALKPSRIADFISYYSLCRNILSMENDIEPYVQSFNMEFAYHISESTDIRIKYKTTNFDYYEFSSSLAIFF